MKRLQGTLRHMCYAENMFLGRRFNVKSLEFFLCYKLAKGICVFFPGVEHCSCALRGSCARGVLSRVHPHLGKRPNLALLSDHTLAFAIRTAPHVPSV